MTVGTSRGIIEQYFAGDANNRVRVKRIFGNFWQLFYSMCGASSPCELIALQFGDGGTAGPDIDPILHPDFGEGAFFVVRFKKTGESGTSTLRQHSIYLLGQFFGNGTNGGTLGAPAAGVDGGNTTIGIQTVTATNLAGADTNPWTGTSLKDGSDTKGATPGVGPVWDAGAGNVYVQPRANAPGGPGATARQYVSRLFAQSDANSGVPATWAKAHFFADDDTFKSAVDYFSSDAYDITVSGLVTPRSGILPPVTQSIYFRGNPDTDVDRVEGVLCRVTGSTWQIMDFCNYVPHWTLQPFQPNVQADPADYEDFPVIVRCNESPYYGYLGIADTMRYASNRTQMSLNTPMTTIHLGADLTLNNHRWLLPWDGVTDPGSGLTVSGTMFAI